MKNLFRYEINESIAAKAAMNCVHKRLFKEYYFGHPIPQEQVMNGEYDIDEWENDAFGNGPKRELVHQALVKLGCTQTVEEGWKYNNIIQKLINDKNPKITNLEDAKKFVKENAKELGVVIKPETEISEQEESTYNEKQAIAKQVMANYNPETDEYEDPSVWILYAIQDHIGKQFLKMPKKEVKAWKKVIDETIAEYEFEKQHPAHYEDEDEARLQSQLANAWDEGMEDDYVPYENKFDETHNDVVDTLLRAVEQYFDYEEDVNGFYRFNYTEDQLGKAVEQILDKYGDFPSSNNFDKCYAWTKKHAGEIIKVLENGSLDNSYEGHPEFDFSEQEEDYGMNDLRKWRDSLDFSNNTGVDDEEDYSDDSVGIDMIADLLVADGEIDIEEKEAVKPHIKELLDYHGLWIGEDEHEAERFINLYWDN